MTELDSLIYEVENNSCKRIGEDRYKRINQKIGELREREKINVIFEKGVPKELNEKTFYAISEKDNKRYIVVCYTDAEFILRKAVTKARVEERDKCLKVSDNRIAIWSGEKERYYKEELKKAREEEQEKAKRERLVKHNLFNNNELAFMLAKHEEKTEISIRNETIKEIESWANREINALEIQKDSNLGISPYAKGRLDELYEIDKLTSSFKRKPKQIDKKEDGK